MVDATFGAEKYRQAFMDAASAWGVPGGILLCQADPDLVRQRLGTRQNDVSDADWSVYLRLAEKWEEPAEPTRRLVHAISTNSGAEAIFAQALAVLRAAGLA